MLSQVLRALTWNDSASSLRACALALPALRGALAAGRVCAGEAGGALSAVLHALRLHGQHDANQAALLQLAVQVGTGTHQQALLTKSAGMKLATAGASAGQRALGSFLPAN